MKPQNPELSETPDYKEWVGYKLWTLIEASCVLAGRNPTLPERFEKSRKTGGPAAAIYNDLKDAIDLQEIDFVEARDGTWQNRRVKPSEVMEWAERQGHELPPPLVEITRPSQSIQGETERSTPVSKNRIIATFGMYKEADWDARMRNCGRKINGDKNLKECRASKGKGGRPSLWYPDLIAAWLVDKKQISPRIAANILKQNFQNDPVCLNTAESLLSACE